MSGEIDIIRDAIGAPAEHHRLCATQTSSRRCDCYMRAYAPALAALDALEQQLAAAERVETSLKAMLASAADARDDWHRQWETAVEDISLVQEMVQAAEARAEDAEKEAATLRAVSVPDGFLWDDVEQRPVYTLYTATETAENLGVNERTIRRWIESGRLPAEKQGGEYRINQDDARAAMVGTRVGRPASLETYVEWLERENERLWALLEKAVS